MLKVISRMQDTGQTDVDGNAIYTKNPDFPKYLSIGTQIFFTMPDVTNLDHDPAGLWNAGMATIKSFYTKDKTQRHQAPRFEDILTIKISSESYPGEKGPFDIRPEHVGCVFKKVEENQEDIDND